MTGRNIFTIGRRANDEDQLTEMVAWLAGAVPEVSHALLVLALGLNAADGVDDIALETQVVVREGRLDVLLLAPNAAVVIESKLGSGYGQSQLRRYADWLADEHPGRGIKALMTLTRNPAPWPKADIDHARSRGVSPVERRWEELHELLELHAADQRDLTGELVREFLEMLSQEGLVPVRPLSPNELGGVWAASRDAIVRYHEFFQACKPSIAEALGAEIMGNSRAEHFDYMWQGFRLLPDRERLVVGIWHTDEGVPIKGQYTNAPIVWMALDAPDWPDWKNAVVVLEQKPPEGWLMRGKRWYGRPEVWCYLHEVLGVGSFEAQRDRFAARCARGRDWAEAARSSRL